MPKLKLYFCLHCQRTTAEALYLRLAVNRCGVRKARRFHLQQAFPIGHYCLECASLLVQSILGRAADLSRLLTPTEQFESGKTVCKQTQC
jgi:hypothetical protein